MHGSKDSPDSGAHLGRGGDREGWREDTREEARMQHGGSSSGRGGKRHTDIWFRAGGASRQGARGAVGCAQPSNRDANGLRAYEVKLWASPSIDSHKGRARLWFMLRRGSGAGVRTRSRRPEALVGIPKVPE